MSVRDTWSGSRTRPTLPNGKLAPAKRWEVRWYTPDGHHPKRSFSTREQADSLDARMRAGIEPRMSARGQQTVGQLVDLWLATTTGLQESTQKAYAIDAKHVRDKFGERLATDLKPSEVRAWSAGKWAGASHRKRSLQALRRSYQLAIADNVLQVDPTAGARMPKIERTDVRFLSWQELERLAAQSEQPALIWLLGTGGMRIGEAIRLDQADVDRARGRLRIRKSKNGKPRDVPIDPEILALQATAPGPLFRGARGGRLNEHNWRERDFKPAAVRADLGDMHPHELRHTAASMAIAAGADVKAVQRMLGHETAAMTTDLYGHLWDDQLDTVAVRLGEARRVQIGYITPQEGTREVRSALRSAPLDSAFSGPNRVEMPSPLGELVSH